MRGPVPVVLFGLLAACTVDRSVLHEQVYRCEADEDCIDGYGCLDLAPYGEDACMPLAAEGCEEGSETATGFCLDRCVVGDASCAPGYSCVRGFLIQESDDLPEELSDRIDAGYCLPVEVCESNDDCGSGEICLSDFFEGESVHETDGSVCVPKCEDDDECGDDEICLPDGFEGRGGARICVPECDDGLCPPLFTCLDVFEDVRVGPFSVPPFCLPGAFGLLPCQDEAGCLVGDCVEAGDPGQRYCSVDGCAGICGEPEFNPEDPWIGTMCDQSADACITILGWLSPCSSDLISCAPGLTCHDFGGGGPPFCSLRCDDLGGCDAGQFCEKGFCFPQLEPGADCARDEQCQSGSCLANRCAAL